MSIHYERYNRLKLLFIVLSVFVVIVAMYFTHVVVHKLSEQEKTKMEIWAEATSQLINAEDEADMSLVLKVLNSNSSVPVMVVDEYDKLISIEYGIRNIELPEEGKEEFLKEKIQYLKKVHKPIIVEIDSETKYFVYYDESFLIKNLTLFTFIILAVSILFLIVAFIAFANTKKSEQNQIWVGFSKETAHQLGTPISSLLAWTEILKSMEVDKRLIREMGEDINRLSIIAERFSKIGSNPTLEEASLTKILENAVLYIKNRSSKKVEFITNYYVSLDDQVNLNISLFEWVIENLCKNAIDAMDGEGQIEITVNDLPDYFEIDITDTGKGIPKSKYKAVFNPGYTTKRRGWGLGLSFVKRIIKDYHAGKIFVKHSEINVGTTFRIQLQKINK